MRQDTTALIGEDVRLECVGGMDEGRVREIGKAMRGGTTEELIRVYDEARDAEAAEAIRRELSRRGCDLSDIPRKRESR